MVVWALSLPGASSGSSPARVRGWPGPSHPWQPLPHPPVAGVASAVGRSGQIPHAPLHLPHSTSSAAQGKAERPAAGVPPAPPPCTAATLGSPAAAHPTPAPLTLGRQESLLPERPAGLRLRPRAARALPNSQSCSHKLLPPRYPSVHAALA